MNLRRQAQISCAEKRPLKIKIQAFGQKKFPIIMQDTYDEK